MALTQLGTPYPVFTDLDGKPLDQGFLYFGEVDRNPETNPITVYYDAALTQPAVQPLRTSNGYVLRNGSPAILYSADLFSVTVRNAQSELVVYAPVSLSTSTTNLFQGPSEFDDVAALVSDTALSYSASVTQGDIVRTSQEGFTYEIAASGASDQDVTTAGGVKLYVQPKNGSMPFLAFNPANDASTDDSAIYSIAKIAAERESVPLNLMNCDIANTTAAQCPTTGFFGSGTFSGSVKFLNQDSLTSGHEQVKCADVVIAGLFFGDIGPIFYTNSCTIQGSDATRGMFWTKVARLRGLVGPVTIDVTDWPANQNTFQMIYAPGVLITGTGTNSADVNWFVCCDTTGANLTGPDGITGYHIVDENDRGANLVTQWYTEGTGKRNTYGEWDIIGARINYDDSGLSFPPNRHMFGVSGAAQTRNISDYQAVTENMAVGGDWSIVDVSQSVPRPPCFYTLNAGTLSVVADSNDPSGLGYRFQGVSSSAFGAIGFTIPQYNGGFISAAFWLYAPDGIDSIICDTGTLGTNNFADPSLYDAGNDWYLCRISSRASADSSTPLRVRVMFNTGATVSRTIGISSIWASNFRTGLIPTASASQSRKGISTDGTTNATDTLPVGAIVENKDTSLASSDTALWIKNSGGTFAAIATVP